jgi:hypothetical protein
MREVSKERHKMEQESAKIRKKWEGWQTVPGFPDFEYSGGSVRHKETKRRVKLYKRGGYTPQGF